MKLCPSQHRLPIRRVEPEARTAGGIFRDTVGEELIEGESVAVGRRGLT